MAERKASDKSANRAGVPKSQEESPVSPAVEDAGVTKTAPGEIVVPESVPGADTGVPAEAAPDPLRGITGQPRENPDPTPDVHADPPPGEGLTPEDEVREEHIRRKMTGEGGGSIPELLEAKVEAAQAAVDALRDGGADRLARQMQVDPKELEHIRLRAVDLDAPPVLGHKLASHDEHRLASDDDRSGADKVKAAVLEARYPVTVTQAEFEEALRDEALSDDNRMEARQMARRNEIYVLGR